MSSVTILDVLERWRAIGPLSWAESDWILPGGRPIVLTDWQRAVLAAWWEHRQTTTTLGISNVKKTGKTTINAILTAWRWLALPGEHFCCANDMDQSVGRQFGMIVEMCTRRHPALGKHVTYLKGEHTLTFQSTGSVLEALAVDASGNAGSNHLTSSHTEAWGVEHEGAVASYEELTPPPGYVYGLPSLRVVDSYAGSQGMSETWHKLVDRGVAGELVSDDWPIYRVGGLLLFHAQGPDAQERCFRGTPTERAEFYTEQHSSLRDATYNRLHLNTRTAPIGGFIDQDAWLALVDPDHVPLEPGTGQPVFLGLDVAVRPGGDDCALVALYTDGDKVKVAWHKVWKGGRARTEDLQLTGQVQQSILKAAQHYNIVGLAADPWQAYQLCQNLQNRGMNVVTINQNKSERGRAVCDHALWTLARNGELVLYDHPDLIKSALYAGVEELSNGLLFIKKLGGRGRVDLLVAMSNSLAATAFLPRYEESIVDRSVQIGPRF